MSAAIQHEITADIMADFRQFVLVDWEGFARLSAAITADRTPEDIVFGGDGGVVFVCSDDLSQPRVTLQRWSAEPVKQMSDWTHAHDSEFGVRTKKLTLGCLTGASTDVTVELPMAGQFGIRAYWKISDRKVAADFVAEDWLVQVWPI